MAWFGKGPPVSQLPPDNFHPERDLVDQLRHGVNNPLAIIRGHAQLMRLRLQRPDGLNVQAVSSMLAQLAAIDAAVSQAVGAIDAFEEATGETEHGEMLAP